MITDQGWPKPGKQGTDESEQILANLDETEQTGQKTGILVKNGAKKRAKETEPWQNRAKPKTYRTKLYYNKLEFPKFKKLILSE